MKAQVIGFRKFRSSYGNDCVEVHVIFKSRKEDFIGHECRVESCRMDRVTGGQITLNCIVDISYDRGFQGKTEVYEIEVLPEQVTPGTV